MSENAVTARQPAIQAGSETTTFAILVSLSVCHLLNDMNQSLVPALYPILKDSYRLDFGQIGLIALAFQLTASLLQPVVGMVTDRRPQPYSLPVAMGCSLIGLLLLAMADNYLTILFARGAGRRRLVGVPPRILARRAHGLGRAPRLRAIAVPGRRQHRLGDRAAARRLHRRAARPGQRRLVLAAALLAIVLLANVGLWYSRHLSLRRAGGAQRTQRRLRDAVAQAGHCSRSPSWWRCCSPRTSNVVSLSSYYTFYLIHKFGVSVQDAQIYLFVFLGAVAAGTFAGGPIGDRFGRKPVIWFSILGAFPFALMLPYANLFWTGVLTVVDRPDPGLGLLRDPGLCAGAAAGPGRHGRGHVLRLLVRPGRTGRRGAGRDRRLDQHRHRLPGLLVPAADRAAHRVPAEYRARRGLKRRSQLPGKEPRRH